MSAMENEYILEGLSCSHCASLIEEGAGKLPWVKGARINLATQVLHLDITDLQGGRQEEIQKLVDSIEDGILVNSPEDFKIKKAEKAEKVRAGEKEKGAIGTLLKGRIPEILGTLLFASILYAEYGELLSFLPKVLLYGLSYILVGRGVLISGLKNLKRGRILDENFLMLIATAGAFSIQEFHEAVAVMLFYQIGEFFQDLAVDRSRRSIRSLVESKPGKIQLITDGGVQEVEAEAVTPGSLFRVRPGDRIALDGIVRKGQGLVDTSALTGESYPQQVSRGSSVFGGFVNKEGVLEIESTKSLSESSFSRIIKMVEDSGSRKARSEKFITRFARYYTPAVVVLAFLLAVVPPLLLDGALFQDWISRALVFLVVSCPCALVISIPLGFFAGIGKASRNGILVKGGNYLEALNRVDSFYMDKTGTLTKGSFSLSSLKAADGVNPGELLRLAAGAESASTHPIAQSIMAYWEKEKGDMSLPNPENLEELAGRGIRATLDGQCVMVGQDSWLREEGFSIPKESRPGESFVHVTADDKYLGALGLSDEIRSDSPEAIAGLKASGIRKVCMLTGDCEETASAVASALSLDAYQAGLLPQDKVRALETGAVQGEKTAFVGDGINDAPVLARADVGIAMGGLGSDAAIEAADIVLMADEPSRLVVLRSIARKTRTVVVENIVLALGVKGLILVLAALGMAGMGWAVFGDVGVALLAVLNVLRIMSSREPTFPNESSADQ